MRALPFALWLALGVSWASGGRVVAPFSRAPKAELSQALGSPAGAAAKPKSPLAAVYSYPGAPSWAAGQPLLQLPLAQQPAAAAASASSPASPLPFLPDPSAFDAAAAAQLVKRASKAATAPITTIVDKQTPSPSGDPHDYVSYSRYYWPDPSKPDGLPYIQRDGYPNLDLIKQGDEPKLDHFVTSVANFALCWALSRDAACAAAAGAWLHAWLVSPATRMNPSLSYAQIKLGRKQAGGGGIIDTHIFPRLVRSLELLRGSPALSAADDAAVRGWLGAYLDWLLSSPDGKAQHAAANNHGTWFDAQVVSIARYLGRSDTARAYALGDRDRIEAQIRPDGSQPLEEARADGFTYSVFNLQAHFVIAELASGALGVDLWNYTAPSGGSLRVAYAYLAPYNADPSKWPGSQLNAAKPGLLEPLSWAAAKAWGAAAAALPPAPGQH